MRVDYCRGEKNMIHFKVAVLVFALAGLAVCTSAASVKADRTSSNENNNPEDSARSLAIRNDDEDNSNVGEDFDYSDEARGARSENQTGNQNRPTRRGGILQTILSYFFGRDLGVPLSRLIIRQKGGGGGYGGGYGYGGYGGYAG